ncbi:unnamed protein product [Ceratitis capitata]|uniref:(Mediterranean fruit fly) hypothetical protein n=1 Tax=Ceratitis capitata TaxID=7213 RepID=A0A811VAI5_CERCA|nr:unnamed protein product [Ceratitis capitata]
MVIMQLAPRPVDIIVKVQLQFILEDQTDSNPSPTNIKSASSISRHECYVRLGLSNGVYYHSNSFAVGAPNVDRVFYYSSYPVVKINASLKATNAFIPLNATQVEINICADSSYGRISIGVCIDELITVRLEPKCFVCQPNITSDEASVFVPMLFELSYLLYNNTKSSKDSEFCKECAVVDPSFPNVTRTTIQYLHDCEGNVCVVDLQLRSVDIPIELITSAEIWITESSAGDIISIKDAADTVGITRSYIIQNSGPSSLKTPHLIVEFPISQKSKGDSFEYYVSNYSAQFGESKPTMTAKVNGTEFLNINHIPNEQTIFLSCQPNLDMLCSLSNFTLLGLFKPEKNLTLTLQYTIHLKVLEKLILANKDNLAHVVTVDLRPAGELRGFLNIKKRINAVLVVKISKRSVLWIYIVASLGGLLLLTCISLLLKRRGFFKRLSKEDMEQTFKENEEKALMHKSLDECVAEMEETEQELPDVECTKK